MGCITLLLTVDHVQHVVVRSDLFGNRASVLPSDVVQANRMAKMRELDAQLVGLFITRAAISEVTAEEFTDFMEYHVEEGGRRSDRQYYAIPVLCRRNRGCRCRSRHTGDRGLCRRCLLRR